MTGAILIDGHHVFLETIGALQRFNELAAQKPLRDLFGRDVPEFGRIQNIWQPLTPVRVAECIGDQLEWDLPRIVTFLTPMEAEPSDVEIVLCDARLAPREEVVLNLQAKQRHISLRSGILERVRKGEWQFYRDGGQLILPYDFKNSVIEGLLATSGRWAGRFGKRKLDIRPNGFVYDREKGVDAQLIIRGCELAADPSVQWVCLVTNDSDYVPLVQHLHHKAKSVYWLSYADNLSRDLRDAVGLEHVIEREQVLSGYHDQDYFRAVRDMTRRVSRNGSPIARMFASQPTVESLYLKCLLSLSKAWMERSAEQYQMQLEQLRKTDPAKYRAIMAKIDEESPF